MTRPRNAIADDFLRTPEDLVKLALVRSKIDKEKASIEAKLQSGAKDQLDATRDGLHKLRDTRVAVGTIREEMANIERLCEDPSTRVDGFSRISEVSTLHRQFERTVEMVQSLSGMYAKIDHIEDMLADEKRDTLGPAPKLLIIHFLLTEIESFRNSTMHQAKRASPDARKTLERYFERLGGTIARFEAHYFDLAANLIPLANRGNASVAVKLAKIAELEGARDEKAAAIKLVMKQNQEMANRFKNMNADARTLKHYRARTLDAIRTSVHKSIEQEQMKAGDHIVPFLEGASWIYKDLIVVEELLAHQFPADWKIHMQFVKAYHKNLYDLLKSVVASEPDAATLLRIAQYCKDYHKTMTKELELDPEWMTPKLLDGKEGDLIEDYLKLIVRKVEEWAANLMRTLTKEFVERSEPPEEDSQGQYGMQGAVIMFQMINQQADLAADSGQGSVLSRVVEETARVMISAQSQWTKLMDAELKRLFESKPQDEVPGGLVEYVMALANDQVKSAGLTEDLSSRLESLVSKKYSQPIQDRLTDALDGYLDVAKHCVQVLISATFNDAKPATKQLFSQQWYLESPVTLIVETIRDYMEDYQAHLHPSLVDLLVEDMLDMFLVTYISSMKKTTKLRMPACVDVIRDDVRKSFTFFLAYKQQQDLEGYFQVVDDILRLLTASKMMFLLDYTAFSKRHGSAGSIPFVEWLLKARDDLDRSDVKEIMESVKRKAPEPEPEIPSILTRLPVEKGGFQALGGLMR